MTSIQLGLIDYAILTIYFVFVLGIGWALRHYMKTSTDFFLSGRSIPAWITGLAFISANLGAQEVIGMGASGAKYGIATSHFYWDSCRWSFWVSRTLAVGRVCSSGSP